MTLKRIRWFLLGLLILQPLSVRMASAQPGLDAAGAPLPAESEAAAVATDDRDLISVDFSGADIQSVLKILALKGNVNIVAGPEVQGDVTIQLKDVPWVSALETIVRTYGYAYERKGNIYQVGTPEALDQTPVGAFTSKVVTLDYATIGEVAPVLGSVLSSSGSVNSISGTNQLVITDSPAFVESAMALLESIDRRMPQVQIETKIVRTTLSNSENFGLNWNTIFSLTGSSRPTTFPFADSSNARRLDKFLQRFDYLPLAQTAAETTTTTTEGGGVAASTQTDFPLAHDFPFVERDDFTFGTIDFSQFQVIFNMLESRGNTKIISNPRIVVVNHQSANIQVGEEIGIPTLERNDSTGAFEVTGFESRDTGIVLNVTPHVTEQFEVLLHVRPEVSDFVGFQPITDTNLTSPTFSTVVAETTVLINSGDTLVIGGLISEEESDTQSKVPWVSRIPIAGWLFKHEAPQRVRTETIFFITTTLVDDVFNQEALAAWRQSQKEYEEYRKEGDNFLHKRQNKKKDEV